MEDILFEETQQFRQWWLWLILLLLMGDVVWQFFQIIEHPDKAGFNEILGPAIITILPLAIVVLIGFCKLETKITASGIYVKFNPIHRKFRFYDWQEIAKVYVRKYRPITEYGGWGIRGWGSNRALNISGNIGLQLLLKNGNRLLIGTRQPEQLNQILAQIEHAPVAEKSFA